MGEKKEVGTGSGTGKDLVKTQAFEVMDKADENLIVEQLKGHQLPDVYVYQYEDRGTAVTGLSVVGVGQVRRKMAEKNEVIRVLGDPQIRETEKEIYVIVKAGRYKYNKDGKEYLFDVTYGAKRQSKVFPGWKKTPNPFFFETGISKAERNAVRRLLDEPLAQSLINACIKGGKNLQKLNGKKPAPSQEEKTLPKDTKIVPSDDKKLTEDTMNKIVSLLIGKTTAQTKVLIYSRYGIEELDDLGEANGQDFVNFLQKKKTEKDKPVKTSTKKKEYDYFCSNEECGKGITKKVNDYSMKKYGKALCFDCQKEEK